MGFRIQIVVYGLVAAAAFVCAGVAFPAQAQVKETVLYSFSGGADGLSPYVGLIADERGALYGTTGYGGAFPAGCFGLGCGAVFKLTPPGHGQTAWIETVPWSFSGGGDGAHPFGGLFARNESPSSKKRLYGTTSFGGAFPTGCFGFGCGTVFKLTDATLTTLWSFTGGSDGAVPGAALIGDEETGALYGTTGGIGSGASGNGTVFKIDTIDQTLATIYSFSGSPDGATPGTGALLADDKGALYGTTFAGGVSGNGVVFKLTPPARGQTTWTEAVLWSFTGGSDGAVPQAGLIADERGTLYGTTSAGASGHGSVFKLTPPARGQTAWTLTTLYTFSGGGDGGFSTATLIADETGALYGTTEFGGTLSTPLCSFFGGCGVVFKLTPPASGQTAPWTETVLWTFTGSDGAILDAGLIADESGALYGTTQFGGTFNTPACTFYGCGVVFKLTGTGFAR